MNNIQNIIQFFKDLFYKPLAPDEVHNRIQEAIPQWPSPSPSPSPSPTPQGSTLGAQYNPSDLEKAISSGLASSNFANAPISTLSAQLANAGSRMTGKGDPYLPTIIALMESRGLLDPKPQAAANPYNIMLGGHLVNYEGNPGLAIQGGQDTRGVNRKGFAGILRPGGPYSDYLQSGNLKDFFAHFTPASDPLNPSPDELVSRYQNLRQMFPQ